MFWSDRLGSLVESGRHFLGVSQLHDFGTGGGKFPPMRCNEGREGSDWPRSEPGFGFRTPGHPRQANNLAAAGPAWQIATAMKSCQVPHWCRCAISYRSAGCATGDAVAAQANFPGSMPTSH